MRTARGSNLVAAADKGGCLTTDSRTTLKTGQYGWETLFATGGRRRRDHQVPTADSSHQAASHLVVESPFRSPPRKRQQCTGRTYSNGARCIRTVASATVPKSPTSSALCHQHRQEAELVDQRLNSLHQSRKTRHESFSIHDQIDPSLSVSTKRRLVMELTKPLSTKDCPGYIYVYQLILHEGDDEICHKSSMYKIGRTNNIERRLAQWSTRCGFRPKLVAQFKVPQSSHRCERLIHLELSERFGMGPIICPGRCREAHYEWFSSVKNDLDLTRGYSRRKASLHESCCCGSGDWSGHHGTCHRQRGWDEISKIIEKWVAFVSLEKGVLGGDATDDPAGSWQGDRTTNTKSNFAMPVSPNMATDTEDAEAGMENLVDALSCLCLRDIAYDISKPLPSAISSRSTPVHSVPPRNFHRDPSRDSGEDETWFDAPSSPLLGGEIPDGTNKPATTRTMFNGYYPASSRAYEVGPSGRIKESFKWEDLKPSATKSRKI
ncbi:meiotically up-regulated gene 113-domain-containing protein [Phlyctochytrium arcticum]|nr:meiotically up-regulated gene 113-domain-containing protein [Phlyctochytrium arcticum]